MKIVKVGSSSVEYRKMIERYKVQNPVKYARKEKVLLARLAQLEAQEPKEDSVDESVETPRVERPKRK